jgi:hypothetical protein
MNERNSFKMEQDRSFPPMKMPYLQAAYPGQTFLPSAPLCKEATWRKGKWFDEEEAYTEKLIESFTKGYLNLPAGTTLRSFLAEELGW